MRTRHTVRDGRKHFPIWIVAGFFLRLIGFSSDEMIFLLVTDIMMENFMFKNRNLSHLYVKKKQIGPKTVKFTNQETHK